MPRLPAWLLAAKVLLVGMLAVGAAFPHVGGFEGKGMLFRLPLFTAPALIVPLLWLRHRDRPYQVLLDAGFTLPFLLDTAGNAFGFYDHVDATDDVLHFVNWFLLVGGITAALSTKAREAPRWLTWTAGAGIGAAAIIGWEAAEYEVMQAGVAGLHLTYGDTLGDLLLSTAGGALGAWSVLRLLARSTE